MNKKLEKTIRKIVYPILLKASLGQIKEQTLGKILNGYIKFLDIAGKIITGVSISGTFLWFFPIYLKLSYERVMLIVLVIIMLWLKFGKIKVNVE